MLPLFRIFSDLNHRTSALTAQHHAWPCRKGCSDCCRSLASEPLLAEPEWRLIAEALAALDSPTAAELTHRIRATAGSARPVTCPLLDLESGACLIYEARPAACRTYGFYRERDKVLGCTRIEALSDSAPDLIWGNQAAIHQRLGELGPAKPLSAWLAEES